MMEISLLTLKVKRVRSNVWIANDLEASTFEIAPPELNCFTRNIIEVKLSPIVKS
jgi:hypothetical protein